MNFKKNWILEMKIFYLKFYFMECNSVAYKKKFLSKKSIF